MGKARPSVPDLLVRYSPEEGLAQPAGGELSAYAVIYVRPETNRVAYERAILEGVRRYAELVYMANLNGALFLRDRILQDHYAAQFRFALDPHGQLLHYPEIARRVEGHFRLPPDRAPLIGSFAAVKRLGISEEELFGTIVGAADFLDCWGQEFKRIDRWIVVNPNLPAVVERYTPAADVFTVAVRGPGGDPGFFAVLNQAIYSEVTSRSETPVIDGQKLDALVWSEKVRRTYHVSANHLMAMFDMADFIYLDERRRLPVPQTPLGRRLVGAEVVSAESLEALKQAQLAYCGTGPARALLYLPAAAGGMKMEEIAGLLGSLQP